jgi:hypothetical protein
MTLRLNELKRVFEDLIDESISLEDADVWASSFNQANLENKVNYIPKKLENKLWNDGIMYLLGIDMKVDKDTYLYSIEDIKKFYNENWKNQDVYSNNKCM